MEMPFCGKHQHQKGHANERRRRINRYRNHDPLDVRWMRSLRANIGTSQDHGKRSGTALQIAMLSILELAFYSALVSAALAGLFYLCGLMR